MLAKPEPSSPVTDAANPTRPTVARFDNVAGDGSGVKSHPVVASKRFTERLARLNVLVADDSIVQRALLKGLLEKRKHRVTLASNGQEALAAASSSVFDIVLMDVEMPTMDGLEATRRIRAKETENGTHVPIVGVTTIERQQCIEAGMDDHLSKSDVSRQLDAVLERNTSSPGVFDDVSSAATGLPKRDTSD